MSSFRTTIRFILGLATSYAGVIIALSLVKMGAYSLLQRSTGDFVAAGGSNNTLRRHQEVAQRHDIDILFLGSSRCYTSIDTRPFSRRGLSVFNLGSSSQTPLNSLYVMRRYFSTLRPKIVVLEMYPNMLDLDGVESYYDLLKNSDFCFDWLRMCLAVGKPQAYNATAGWLLGRVFGFSNRPKVQPEYSDWRYVADGFTSTEKVLSDTVSLQQRRLECHEYQTKAFGECLSYILQHQAVPVVVIAPITDIGFNTVENYPDIIGRLRDISENDSVAFLDFSRIPEMCRITSFADIAHLNATGAKLFGESLCDSLFGRPEVRNRLFVR